MRHYYQQKRHAYHAKTHALISVDEIAEVFGSGCDRYPFPIPQLVQSTLDAKVRLPILTIGYIPNQSARLSTKV